MSLKNTIQQFLNLHLNPLHPVLLALSGGSDSICLLHLLRTHPINLHLAHIDHRWRKESSEEALKLKNMAKSLSLPFHEMTLNPNELKGNLEMACRVERMNFYRLLTAEHGFQAVFLAHHRDDLSETVLKRLLEGSSLAYLHGMKEIVQMEGLKLWRPLLKHSKEEILHFLKANQLAWFEDSTNKDVRYLRGRLREQLIPTLNHSFGKNIALPLCRLAKESEELKELLEERVFPYLNQKLKGPFGTLLDLTDIKLRPIELKYLIRRLCELEDVFLSHPILEEIVKHLLLGSANKAIPLGRFKFYVDRFRLFLLKETLDDLLPGRVALQEGTQQFCSWEIQLQMTNQIGRASDWKEVWMGRGQVFLPSQAISIGQAKADARNVYTSLNNWWTNHKIPAFLRFFAPVIWCEDRIEHEFLTGKYKSERDQKEVLEVKIRYKRNLSYDKLRV